MYNILAVPDLCICDRLKIDKFSYNMNNMHCEKQR